MLSAEATNKSPFASNKDSSTFKSNAVCVAVDTGLLASVVLSTLPRPTIVAVIPETVPVKVGEARFALRSRAVCVAVDTGLLESDVLFTLDRSANALYVANVVPVITDPAIEE